MQTADRDGAGAAIKLLTVSNFFDSHRGGLEIVAGQLTRELARRDFDVTWLATRATALPEDADAFRTVAVGAWNVAERRLGVPFPFLSPAAMATVSAEVKRADAVLLHDSLYPISMVTALAAWLHRKPLVVIQHIGSVPYRNPVLRLMMAAANLLVARPLLAGAAQVVFISEFVRDYFAATRLKRPAELIFNGVDTGAFRLMETSDKACGRKRFGLAGPAPVALFVGRFVEKKGLHILKAAAAARPDVRWAFAGWGVLDPTAWDLPNVKVISGASGADLAALYRSADVFVLPSQGEGYPLVIQEALACGLPVVCGAQTATADPAAAPFLSAIDIRDDDMAHNVAELGAAVDRLLADETPDKARARYDFAAGRYSWSAGAARYGALIESLVAGKAAA